MKTSLGLSGLAFITTVLAACSGGDGGLDSATGGGTGQPGTGGTGGTGSTTTASSSPQATGGINGGGSGGVTATGGSGGVTATGGTHRATQSTGGTMGGGNGGSTADGGGVIPPGSGGAAGGGGEKGDAATVAIDASASDGKDARVGQPDGGASPDAGTAADAPISPGANPVDWNTQYVSLHADDFRIEAAGLTFLGQTPGATLHNDPPEISDDYTTFEREWSENGVPMRLYMYFQADGTQWWVDDISIFTGLTDGNWLYSTDVAIRRPRGQDFTGDIDMSFPQQAGSRLVLRGLRLQAFVTPQVCINHGTGYVVEVQVPTIEMSYPDGGYGLSVRLRGDNCVLVVDDSAFAYVWTADNPTLFTIAADGDHAALTVLAPGHTTLRVTVERRADRAVVAQGTMAVTIAAAASRWAQSQPDAPSPTRK